MNSTKILFAGALIAFCCVTFITGTIRCHVCDSEESCNRPRLVNCTAELATVTRAYLDMMHVGINLATTSPILECFRQDISHQIGNFFYRGCTFQNIPGCSFPLRDYLTMGRYQRFCDQCNTDGCNPANRIDINMMTIFATVFVAYLVHYIRLK